MGRNNSLNFAHILYDLLKKKKTPLLNKKISLKLFLFTKTSIFRIFNILKLFQFTSPFQLLSFKR